VLLGDRAKPIAGRFRDRVGSETFVLRSTDAETGDPIVLRVERRCRLMFLAAEVE
jgi:hypothetical protein